ncbi:Large-conductance mechanosensitive channel [Metamycoplasma alkalescens 14918]|uniref:Large-conductance mechanosensitive channel n=1 Tax=Metamycoplasma alkalescens 14918 TaxID=1188234 RepID=N9UB86_9BACT|nr:MscL family protein [Metamycoplasma alkalescens]ENY53976.1 Large-conductance mechanosensitive channel [Metamycoplasma alkalescens 14918]
MTKEELKDKKMYVKKAFKDAKAALKRGNIFMLAIGLLLGASFGAVVASLANDVIMASIASIFSVDSVKDLKAGNVLIGKFLAALIQFLIVTLFVFLTLFLVFLIKNIIAYHRAKKQPIEEPKIEVPQPTVEELILKELQDLNKKFDSISKQKK